MLPDAAAKCTEVCVTDWRRLRVEDGALDAPLMPLPGRASRPELVSPHRVPQRSIASLRGRAALIHALAHIELNAVNLALDIVWRFPGLPEAFYRDWAGVACDEALHFEMLAGHLSGLGFRYGDFPAHNGLWDMAERTRDDVVARLGVVPRLLEARGLDVSPLIRDRLLAAGDTAGAAILTRILHDEVGHVAIGNHWFGVLCAERGLDPVRHGRALADLHGAAPLRGPFNVEARRRAGFHAEELAEFQRANGAGKSGKRTDRRPAPAAAARLGENCGNPATSQPALCDSGESAPMRGPLPHDDGAC